MDKPTKLYRFILDFDIQGVSLKLLEYNIIKHTPQGYWIDIYSCNNKAAREFSNLTEEKLKWVGVKNRGDKKRFAYASKKDAMEHFQRRSLRRIGYLKDNISNIITALEISVESEYSIYDKNVLNRKYLQKFKIINFLE